MEVRIEMLSSGGWLSRGLAVGKLALGRSASMYEGIARGSAKSIEIATGLSRSHLAAVHMHDWVNIYINKQLNTAGSLLHVYFSPLESSVLYMCHVCIYIRWGTQNT